MTEVHVDLRDKDLPGNEEIRQAFEILDKAVEAGKIKSFILVSDLTPAASQAIGVEATKTRGTLTMCGNIPQLMTMAVNILFQFGAQYGKRVPLGVINTYLALENRTDMETPDGKVITQKP